MTARSGPLTSPRSMMRVQAAIAGSPLALEQSAVSSARASVAIRPTGKELVAMCSRRRWIMDPSPPDGMRHVLGLPPVDLTLLLGGDPGPADDRQPSVDLGPEMGAQGIGPSALNIDCGGAGGGEPAGHVGVRERPLQRRRQPVDHRFRRAL